MLGEIQQNIGSGNTGRISLSVVSLGLRIADAFIVILTAVLCFEVYVGVEEWIDLGSYFIAVSVALILQQNLFHIFGVYGEANLLAMRRQLPRLLGGWTSALLVVVLFAFLTKTSTDYSRVWLVTWFGAGLTAFVVLRLILRMKFKRWIAARRLDQNVVVVGGGDQGHRIVEHLLTCGPYLNVFGFVDDRDDRRSPGPVAGVAKLGTTRDLLSIGRSLPVDVVLIALPWSAENRILEIVRVLWELPVEIRLAPQVLAGPGLVHGGYRDFYGVPVLNLMDRPLSEWQKIAKAAEDRILAVTLLLVLAPLMLLIAALIRLESPGPILFRQRRFGFNNQLIEVFKFRTMYAEMTDERAESLTIPGDPRVTRFGAILRTLSLDELPQIFNVLRGEMSLVGPRPHAVAAKAADRLYAEVVDEYAARHRIKPGITGWAQVNGWRGFTDTEEKIRKRIEYDLYYIDHWSIWFDLKILALTVVEIFRPRNAY